VLFGVELGLFIAALCHFFIRRQLEKHVTKVMEGIFVNRYKHTVLGFTVIFLVLLIIILIEYVVAVGSFKPKDSWLYQISVKCPVSQQLYELAFHNAVFAEYGLIFFSLGSYMGLLYDAKHYKGSIKSINKTNLRLTLMRIVISGILVVPFFICPVFLIPSHSYTFMIFLFKYGAPSFIAGFGLNGLSKVVYERFSLLNPDEVSQQESLMNLS
jgi:hypothetical protein